MNRNWKVNSFTGEIFFKGQLILFSSDLIIDHSGYAGFDMCLQVEGFDYYFEWHGGHGLGTIVQNLPTQGMIKENKCMNEQLEGYLNNYNYTLQEFLNLPQNKE